MKERPGTDFTIKADLVLLSMGFLHVVRRGLIEALGLELDRRGNVVVDRWTTSQPGIFAAGETIRRDRAERTSAISRLPQSPLPEKCRHASRS